MNKLKIDESGYLQRLTDEDKWEPVKCQVSTTPCHKDCQMFDKIRHKLLIEEYEGRKNP